MKQVTYVILGYGNRGRIFAELAKLPHINAKIVAVAEPDPIKRAEAVKDCNLNDDMAFESAEELFKKPRLADGLINTTMDKLHAQTSIPAMKKGYALFLEKPMAITLEDCLNIEKTQRETGVAFAVCHSLRYHKLYTTMRKMIADKVIGDIVNFDQIEEVQNIHFSSSYIRGNWGNESRSTFMLMSKSCHDIDIFSYLVGEKCKRVSSFGSLKYFKEENKPEGAPKYCLDGCPIEKDCPYHCAKIYLESDFWRFCFPERDDESVRKYLKDGPFGRCVFQTDNDVVDHQIVNFEYEGGITGTFSMIAFTKEGGRYIRIHGTKGTLEGNTVDNILVHKDFISGNTSKIKLDIKEGVIHDGGDEAVFANLTDAIRFNDSSKVLTTAQESLESHKIVFAAEEARKTGTVINID